MLRRFFVLLGSLGLYFLAFILGASLVLFWFYTTFKAPALKGSTTTVLFEVDKGWGMRQVAEELQRRNLIKSWWSVYWWSKIKKDAKDKQLVAGEYELSPGNTPTQILDHLLSGKKVEHEVAVQPGMDIRDVAKQVAKSGLATEEETLDALKDQNVMAKLGIPAYIPEGYIMAGSYMFSRPITVKQLVFKLVEQGKAELDAKNPGWEGRAVQLGFRPYEILTLASIIEKEAPSPAEKGKVSSLYHNRLRIGMPLQSNKVLLYGLPNFRGDIGQEQIKMPGPYNTYLNTGLPPTPICNPGAEALKAALYPEDTDFLYMLDKGDGTHDFAATYKAYQEQLQRILMSDEGSETPPAP